MTESSQEKRAGEIHEWYLYKKKRITRTFHPSGHASFFYTQNQPSCSHPHTLCGRKSHTDAPAIQLPARLLSPQKSCIVSSPLALGPLPDEDAASASQATNQLTPARLSRSMQNLAFLASLPGGPANRRPLSRLALPTNSARAPIHVSINIG